jgi:hypothetical protein
MRSKEVWIVAVIWAALLAAGVYLIVGCTNNQHMELPPDPPTTRPAGEGGGGVVASQDTSNIKAQLWATATAIAHLFTRDVTVGGSGNTVRLGPSGAWLVGIPAGILLYHSLARRHGKHKHRKAGQAHNPPNILSSHMHRTPGRCPHCNKEHTLWITAEWAK